MLIKTRISAIYMLVYVKLNISADIFLPTCLVTNLQITGQSCPLSFKGSPYWMAPEVGIVIEVCACFSILVIFVDILKFITCLGYKEFKWLQSSCGYMESWVHSFGDGHYKASLESV